MNHGNEREERKLKGAKILLTQTKMMEKLPSKFLTMMMNKIGDLISIFHLEVTPHWTSFKLSPFFGLVSTILCFITFYAFKLFIYERMRIVGSFNISHCKWTYGLYFKWFKWFLFSFDLKLHFVFHNPESIFEEWQNPKKGSSFRLWKLKTLERNGIEVHFNDWRKMTSEKEDLQWETKFVWPYFFSE